MAGMASKWRTTAQRKRGAADDAQLQKDIVNSGKSFTRLA
jgi:hypothetical protein